MQSRECHWWFPYKGLVLISEKPTALHVNGRGQLHKDEGLAIEYSDGWGVYALNGVRLPKEHVMTPAEQLDPKIVLNETNVEIRRELLRKIGIERFLQVTPHKVLNKKGDYQLLSVALSDEIRDARYLKMLNPSIGTWHVEAVHPDCSTVQQAINWRAGSIDREWAPEVLT